MDKFLTNYDFNTYIKKADDNVIKYGDLSNYDTIEDLLPKKKDYKIMLIETQPSVGHWVAILRDGDHYEYFDSYGVNPTSHLKSISSYMKSMLGMKPNDINKLLSKIPKSNFKYNKMKLQKMEDGINTCGRWVITRIQDFLKGGSLIDYQNKIKKGSKMNGMSTDEYVVSIS
tara:strand:- start:9152 stop:9667 length:516 start_codon:yes stop_codon:yes gene_type:complete